MTTTAWALILQDTLDRIAGAEDGDPAGITPSVDATQRWRLFPRGRQAPEADRDRAVMAKSWSPVSENLRVHGGNEDQLGRDLVLEVRYLDSEDFEDRRHGDEQDLIAALEPRTSYPSGATWALYVRRVMREAITVADPEGTTVKVTIPIRLIWREAARHVA